MARPRKAEEPQAPQAAQPEQPKEAKNPSKINYRSRENRKPMTGLNQRLSADIPEGLVGHWFADRPGRVQRAIEAGWMFAHYGVNGVLREDDGREGAIFEEHADTNARGESVRQYLMLIPRELYEEDYAAKQARLDKQMEAIKRGSEHKMQAGDNAYNPDVQNKMP